MKQQSQGSKGPQGLSAQQAAELAAAGKTNRLPAGLTPSVPKIFLSNILTPFNIVNALLAVAVVAVGSPRNAIFFLVAVCNTFLGILQELRAKRTLDKLSILSRGTACVVRAGQPLQLSPDDVVLGDVLLLAAGDQICADGRVVQTEGFEVDESLLSGEADPVAKRPGTEVLSGSFVVAGQAYVEVTAVGRESYAGRLSVEAKKTKKPAAPLMRTLQNIIRVLGIAILPVGLLLFYSQYAGQGSLQGAVLGATAAMVGMIPEGLILLTGVTLTLGALKLARRGALVQALPSIETLARADVLCLDKTGTITDGTLSLEALLPGPQADTAQMEAALAQLMQALPDDNPTAHALRAAYPRCEPWACAARVPFSSRRKWSAAGFAGQGAYVLGAPAMVVGADDACMGQAEEYARKGMRVLCLAHTEAALQGSELPPGLHTVGLVVLADSLRADAAQTFRLFAEEGVALKVISGDDALTVSTIAAKAGIAGAERYVDMSTWQETDFAPLVREYTVFGRVSPEQKQALVAALKEEGHTVCMTGDGVNDVLAMKEADCGIAMLSGSAAARGAADFVLMESDFSAMVNVLKEGRQVINNIEKVASMYLVKTVYSAVLALLYAFIPYPYPFEPLQMTPINSLTVGIPSFFLALRGNTQKPEGRFLANVLENSVPAALCVLFNILVIRMAGTAFGLSQLEISTMSVLLTATVGFRLMWRVSKPRDGKTAALAAGLVAAFLLCLLVFGDFFGYGGLLSRNVFFYLPLIYIGPRMFTCLSAFVRDWVIKHMDRMRAGRPM